MPRGGDPRPAARFPWMPYAIGGVALVVLIAAIVYAAATGRLF